MLSLRELHCRVYGGYPLQRALLYGGVQANELYLLITHGRRHHHTVRAVQTNELHLHMMRRRRTNRAPSANISSRSVPAQFPHSSRSVPATVPARESLNHIRFRVNDGASPWGELGGLTLKEKYTSSLLLRGRPPRTRAKSIITQGFSSGNCSGN